MSTGDVGGGVIRLEKKSKDLRFGGGRPEGGSARRQAVSWSPTFSMTDGRIKKKRTVISQNYGAQ